MTDDLVSRLRDLAQAKHDDLSIGDEAAARIAALEAAVTQCRTLSAMLKPQADRIAELEEELSIWRSVFPDIAPERVLPDRRLLRNRIEELQAALATARRDAMEEAAKIADTTAHANRVEYPKKWKDRPKGIPHDWAVSWETCAETAEEIAAAIRAALEGGKKDG